MAEVKRRPKNAVTVNKDKFILTFFFILVFDELLVSIKLYFYIKFYFLIKLKKRASQLWGQVMGNLIFNPIP